MSEQIEAGSTDVTIYFQLSDSTTGDAKTGLLYNSAGASCYYTRAGAATVSMNSLVTLASAAAAHTDKGFVEVDGTNSKGLYRLDLVDAVCATGVNKVYVNLEFDNTLVACKEIELTGQEGTSPTLDSNSRVNSNLESINGDTDAASGIESIGSNFESDGYIDCNSEQAMINTTIATLASQTSFTLTSGSTDDDAYNNCLAIITDASTANQIAVAPISDYTGSTKTITLKYDPAIFRMAASDKIVIVSDLSLKSETRDRFLAINSSSRVESNLKEINDDEGSGTTFHTSMGAYNTTTNTYDVNIAYWNETATTISSTTNLPEVDAKSISDSTTAANNVEANISNLNATVSSRSSHTADNVWTVTTRILTAATNITSTGSAIGLGADNNVVISSSQDVYYAFVEVNIDDTNSRDEYTIQWFKNGVPVASGQITSPTIQVINYSGGNLIASTAVSEIGSTGTYYHTETSNRIDQGGQNYTIEVTGTIDTATRTFRTLISRDDDT